MGDPFTMAAMAAMVGGSYMQSRANKQVANKKRDAVNAEGARQRGLREQSENIFKKSLSEHQMPEQQQRLDESTIKRRDAITSKIQSEEGKYLPSQADAPAIIRKIMDDKAREEVGRATSSGEAAAKLGAYDDVGLSNLFGFSRSGQGINNLSRSMANSANILPMELSAANSAGSKSRMWGDILTGIGQIGLMAGTGGAGGSWGDLFGKTGATGKPLNLLKGAGYGGAKSDLLVPKLFS